MVLADLGKKINAAFADLQRTPLIDEKAVDNLLKGLATALLGSDVNVGLVSNLRNRVKSKVTPQLEKLISSPAKQKQLVQKTVYDELVALVNPTAASSDTTSSTSLALPWQPKKGKPNVIMFVGLQGSGKTTSCTKLAVYYQRKGFRTALVCADTFRAGAFDQLKQNAARAKVPFFGSHTETDPIRISAAGVTKFKRERFEVIIVDTSGRHRQETELFEEMKQISSAVQPNLTIMVLDGAIGQAAEAQTRAFKEAAGFGAIIVTKMDGHAKGGGAISAVAATQTPIMFIGTGEHIHDLERFSPGPFISKVLGMADVDGFLERMQDLQQATPAHKREEMRERMERGEFTLRDLRDQMTNVAQMGPLSKMASMIPGMGAMFGGNDDDMSSKMKRMLFIFDAMSPKELDSDGRLFRPPKTQKKDSNGMDEGVPREPHPRILRIARGSGTSVDEVEAMIAQHVVVATMVKTAGGKRKWEQQQALKAAQQQAAKAAGGAGAGRGGRVKQQQVTIDQLVKMGPAQRQQVLRQAPAAVRKQIEDAGGVDAFYALSQAAQRNGGATSSAASRARRAAAAGAAGGPGGLAGMIPGLGAGQMPDPETMKRMMEQMGMGNLGGMFGGRG